MTITILLSSILSCTGCAGEKNSLVGEWSSNHSDGSSATIIFEEGTEGLTGEISIVDTESSKWIKKTFTVNAMDEKNFTMTLLMDDGTVEKTFYVASKDTLYIFGIEFTNPKKNVKTTRTDTYVVDGKITPIIGDVYIGMTREQVKKTNFYKSNINSYGDCEVTNWPVQDAYGTCTFLYNDADRLEGMEYCINFENMPEYDESFGNKSPRYIKASEMNDKLYGAKTSDSPATWMFGNLKITLEWHQWRCDVTYKVS